MADLVKRLRTGPDVDRGLVGPEWDNGLIEGWCALAAEAADEIERLQDMVAENPNK